MNPPTKPSLETCAELYRAAITGHEKQRALASAAKHGYSPTQLGAALASLPPKK